MLLAVVDENEDAAAAGSLGSIKVGELAKLLRFDDELLESAIDEYADDDEEVSSSESWMRTRFRLGGCSFIMII